MAACWRESNDAWNGVSLPKPTGKLKQSFLNNKRPLASVRDMYQEMTFEIRAKRVVGKWISWNSRSQPKVKNLAPDPMKIITIVIKSKGGSKGGFRLERQTEASTMTNIRAGSRTNQLRPQLSLITGQCSRTAPPPVLFSYEFSWEDLK